MDIIFDMPDRRICKICLKDKHCSEFYLFTSRGKKYMSHKCKDCHQTINKKIKERIGIIAATRQRKANKIFAEKHKLTILIYSQLNFLINQP